MSGLWIDAAVAFPAGILLGLVFFGGLRMTVNRFVRGQFSPFAVVMSFAVRMAILLAGFWWIGAGEWQRYGFCLLGVLAGRGLVMLNARKERREAD